MRSIFSKQKNVVEQKYTKGVARLRFSGTRPTEREAALTVRYMPCRLQYSPFYFYTIFFTADKLKQIILPLLQSFYAMDGGKREMKLHPKTKN
jgi:hypothetical protein